MRAFSIKMHFLRSSIDVLCNCISISVIIIFAIGSYIVLKIPIERRHFAMPLAHVNHLELLKYMDLCFSSDYSNFSFILQNQKKKKRFKGYID